MPSCDSACISAAERSECEVPCFEGSEKKMEIIFAPNDGSGVESLGLEGGLRTYNRQYWSDIVALLNGSILLHDPQDMFDAYLISESSLFVYPDRVVILTCGTTTLLKTLNAIIESGEKLDMKVTYFQYSRKNFLFPEQQLYPHTSFDQEVDYMKQVFPDGKPYVFGPLNSDHWYVFVSDHIERHNALGTPHEKNDIDQTLNVYMYDIDPRVAQLFMRADELISPAIFENQEGNQEEKSNQTDKSVLENDQFLTMFSVTAADASDRSGISKLVPGGCVVHDHLFEPCGYSMNGRAPGDSYWTIHITPEAHCSYASFETNLQCDGYADLIRRVVNVFRPKRFTTVEHVDIASTAGNCGPQCPANVEDFKLEGRTLNEFNTSAYTIQVCNYKQQTSVNQTAEIPLW